MHLPNISRTHQYIPPFDYGVITPFLPAEIRASYPQIDHDLSRAIQMTQNADVGTSKRVGRCQIEKLPHNKCKIMIFDVHEKERYERLHGAFKWIKPDNFMLTMDLTNGSISKFKQCVSVSRQSPLFETHDAIPNLIQDGFKEYKKITKDGTIHTIYIQTNKGKTLAGYLQDKKASMKRAKKNLIARKTLKEAFKLVEKHNWQLSDIKLENILISEKNGKIKITLIDYTSEKAVTTNKIPFDFLTYYPFLNDRDDVKKTLGCMNLILISCIEILSSSEELSISDMEAEDIQIAIDRLNKILHDKIIPTLPPELRAFVFEDIVDPSKPLLNHTIYDISCSMLAKGHFLFSDNL